MGEMDWRLRNDLYDVIMLGSETSLPEGCGQPVKPRSGWTGWPLALAAHLALFNTGTSEAQEGRGTGHDTPLQHSPGRRGAGIRQHQVRG